MKNKIWIKTLLILGLISIAFGCQKQAISEVVEKELAKPQTVKFESVEKAEIVGTFYESHKDSSPAVLFLPEWQLGRKAYDEFAKGLQKKGFGVLVIDARGVGESVKTTDGKRVFANNKMETLMAMKDDVSNAFDFLAKQKNVDASRIGIIGAAYGSSLAIMYSAENSKVKAVALISPDLNYFNKLPTEPSVKTYGDRPLLLITAEDDKISVDAAKRLKEVGANDKYELKIYPKGGRGIGIFKAEVGIEKLLGDFFSKSI